MGSAARGRLKERTARRRAALALLVRVLTVLLAVQMSGVGPVLWGDCCSTDDDDCSGETDRKPCGDCPSGCPKCHCAGTPFSVPPPAATDSLDLDFDARPIVRTSYDTGPPREAPHSSIYRPPRV